MTNLAVDAWVNLTTVPTSLPSLPLVTEVGTDIVDTSRRINVRYVVSTDLTSYKILSLTYDVPTALMVLREYVPGDGTADTDSWVLKSAPTYVDSSDSLQIAVTGGYLYYKSGNALERYTPETDTWTVIGTWHLPTEPGYVYPADAAWAPWTIYPQPGGTWPPATPGYAFMGYGGSSRCVSNIVGQGGNIYSIGYHVDDSGGASDPSFFRWNPSTGFHQLADAPALDDAWEEVNPSHKLPYYSTAASASMIWVYGQHWSAELDFFWRYDANTDTWTVLPSPPIPLTGVNLVAGTDERIYLVGGGDSESVAQSSIYRFDQALGTWSRVGDLGVSGGGAPICQWQPDIFGNALYVFGTLTAAGPDLGIRKINLDVLNNPQLYPASTCFSAWTADHDDFYGLTADNFFMTYSLSDDVWIRLTAPDPPTPMRAPDGPMTIVDGDLYFYPSNQNTLLKYVISEDTWSVVFTQYNYPDDMPQQLRTQDVGMAAGVPFKDRTGYPSMIGVRDKLYVWAYQEHDAVNWNTVNWVLDFWSWQPSTDTWTQLTDLPLGLLEQGNTAWEEAAVATTDSWDIIYFHGWTGSDGVIVWAYDIETDTWTSQPAPPYIVPQLDSNYGEGFGAGTTFTSAETALEFLSKKASTPQTQDWKISRVLDGKIYIVTFEDETGYLGLEVYDPATDTWEFKTGPDPHLNAYAIGYREQLAVADGKLYYIRTAPGWPVTGTGVPPAPDAPAYQSPDTYYGSIQSYDVDSDTWTTLDTWGPALDSHWAPYQRTSNTTPSKMLWGHYDIIIGVDTKIYSVGYLTETAGSPFSSISLDFWSYDVLTDTFIQLASLPQTPGFTDGYPENYFDLTLTANDSTIFLYGDVNNNPALTGRNGCFVYAYDIASNTWTVLPTPLVHVRWPGFVINDDGILYLSGGYTVVSPYPAQADIYRLYPGDTVWAKIGEYPKGLYAPSLAVVDGKIYSIAGSDDDNGYTDTVYLISPDAPKTATTDGSVKLYEFPGVGLHGTDYTATDLRFFILDTETGAWRQGPDLPNDRQGAAVVTNRDKIFLIGQCFGASPSSVIGLLMPYDADVDSGDDGGDGDGGSGGDGGDTSGGGAATVTVLGFVPFTSDLVINDADFPEDLEAQYALYDELQNVDAAVGTRENDASQPPAGYTGNSEFFCDPLTSDFDGVIIVHASDMPDGKGTVYREDMRGYVSRVEIRGGGAVNPHDGFVIFDTEAPFNSPVTYILKFMPTKRAKLYNYFTNPSLELSTTGWQAGPNRTLTRVRDGSAPAGVYVGQVSHNALPPSNLTQWDGRMLARANVDLDSWISGRTYRVYGHVKVVPNSVTSWAETRSTPPTSGATMTVPPAHSWSQVRSTNANWKEVVKDTVPDPVIPEFYVSLVNVLDTGPSTVPIITPVKVTPVGSSLHSNAWIAFQAYITLPDPIPGAPDPDIDVIFYHGSTIDEYNATWSLDAVIMDDVTGIRRMEYFDGSTVPPEYPKGIGYQRTDQYNDLYTWDSGDAMIKWEGAPHNSRSIFTGASTVASYTQQCSMDIHEDSVNGMSLCEPVYISDPIIPAYSMWIGLLNIAPLERSARRELVPIYGRHAPIALSEKRATINTTITLMTNTLSERESIVKIVDSGRVMMLRNPDARYPETNWYMSIGDVAEERILPDHRDPRRRWKLDVQLVDRPSGHISSIDGQTWGEADARYDTWSRLKSGNIYWMTLLIGHTVTVATEDVANTLVTDADPGLFPTAKAARWSSV